MPMQIAEKAKDPKIQEEIAAGFIGGLNAFQDETLIKDSELTDAKNIILDIDGISPRPGTENYTTDTGDSKIQGGIGYYQADGTREFLAMSNGSLKQYTTSWADIAADAYSTTADVEFVQARDKVFIFNGVDNLSYYDGSTVTTYTALDTPSAPTVAVQGTSGSTNYSYSISAFNAVGETLASTSTAITTGTSSISASNYNKLSWSAVAGATGYNIWGRYATGIGETYLATVTNATTYDDNQTDANGNLIEPSLSVLPPEADTTAGVICSMGVFAISRIFAAGNPTHPSRLYYSGVGTEIGNFSGSDYGGGYVDVFRNDGSQIRSIIPFQGGVIIFKDNAVYKFSFVTATVGNSQVSLPSLEEITRSFGGISFRSTKAVENDVVFAAKKDGRLAFYSLGNQENYAGSVLRTNELSIKIQDKLTDVNVDKLTETAGLYFNNVYMCAVTKSGSTYNDRVWLLDTRFGAWVYWEGVDPALFMTYEDTSGNVYPLYGQETDGYFVELFKSSRNDNGSAISVRYSTKAFNQKMFYKYKRYFNPTFQYKDVNKSGAISGEIYIDGAVLTGGFSVNQQTSGGAGVGASIPGFTLPGDADGGTDESVGVSSDIVVEAHKVTTGRSIKYNFTSSTKDLFYKFLALGHSYQVLPEKRLGSSQRFYVTG